MNKNSKQIRFSLRNKIYSSILIIFAYAPVTLSQDDASSAPLPGSLSNYNVTIPAKQSETQSPPAPIPAAVSTVKNEESVNILSPSSEDLPVSVSGLKGLVTKYKDEAKEGALSESDLDALINWLDGLIKSHNKLMLAFGKTDLKNNFDSEYSLVRELHQIKNQILYLKAQKLIKEKSLKQAIPILIEITCSEPSSALGQLAYQHLKSSGFSPPQSNAEQAKNTQSNVSSVSNRTNSKNVNKSSSKTVKPKQVAKKK